MIITDNTNTLELLLAHFDTIAGAPGGVARLRQLILQLAVQGRLVKQDPTDEPANVLLERMRAEKAQLIRDGVISKARLATGQPPSELPFEIPVTWTWVQLAEVGHDWGQKTPDAAFTYIDVSAIDNERGVISSEVSVLQPFEAPSRARKLVRPGTLIYSTVRPYLLNIAIIDREFVPESIVSTAFAIIHSFDGVNCRYLYYYLRSQIFVDYVAAQMKGVAYPAINDSQFFSAFLPLPPSQEQCRIVERVDALMVLCDVLEAQQVRQHEEQQRLLAALVAALLSARNADESAVAWERLSASFDLILDAPESVAPLRQTVLQMAVQGRLVKQDPTDEPASVLLERIRAEKARLVKEREFKKSSPSVPTSPAEKPFEVPQNWKWVKLKEFGAFLGGGTPSKAHPEFWEGDISWISPKDMKKLYIDDAQDHISEAALEGSSVQLIPNGSVLFVVRGMILAHSFPVALTKASVTVNQDMKALQFALEGLQEYVLLACRAARERVLAMVERSTHGTCKLNSDSLENLAIPLPPLAEQRRIVARVEQLMTLCDVLEARLCEERTAAERLAESLCLTVTSVPAEQSKATIGVVERVDDTVILELPIRRRPVTVVPTVEAEGILLAYIHQRHLGTPTESTLGRVKAEKIVHLTEAVTRRDLGRRPMRMPRGPADARQLERAIEVGRGWDAFDVPAREHSDWGYQFVPRAHLAKIAARFNEVFEEQAATAARIIDLLVPLKSRQAEAVATLYAVWNDLLRVGEEPDDEQIFAAFRGFHPKKERFRPEVLIKWLAWMREHDLVPDGSAKPTLPALSADEPVALEGTEPRAAGPMPIDFAELTAHHTGTRRAAEASSEYSAAGDDYDAARRLLVERGALTNGKLQAALGINAADARGLLKRLMAEGLARQEGERRGTRYVRIE